VHPCRIVRSSIQTNRKILNPKLSAYIDPFCSYTFFALTPANVRCSRNAPAAKLKFCIKSVMSVHQLLDAVPRHSPLLSTLFSNLFSRICCSTFIRKKLVARTPGRCAGSGWLFLRMAAVFLHWTIVASFRQGAPLSNRKILNPNES